jgi:hypothetical protein
MVNAKRLPAQSAMHGAMDGEQTGPLIALQRRLALAGLALALARLAAEE